MNLDAIWPAIHAWVIAHSDYLLLYLAGIVTGGILFGQHHVRRAYGWGRRQYGRWRGYY